jgi:SagB-type dehydrogenase family enzyme
MLKQILELSKSEIRIDRKTSTIPEILPAIFEKGFFNFQLWERGELLAASRVETPSTADFSIPSAKLKFRWSAFVSLAPSQEGFEIRSTEAVASAWISVPVAQGLMPLTLKEYVSVSDFRHPALFVFLRTLGFLYRGKVSHFQKYWEEHDRHLMSASRRRSLGDLRPIGATYPFADKAPVAPSIQGKTWVRLPKCSAPNLPAVFQQRETKRISSEKSQLNFQDLTNFLLLLTQKNEREKGGDRRIFPVAGNIESPEFVVLNYSCQGLKKGIFFFDSEKRRLIGIDENPERVSKHAKIYGQFWSSEHGVPPVVIQAVRFYPRIAWKYRGMNLKVQMVEGGGILQSAQLVATHLGLGCCPLGIGGTLLSPEGISPSLPWDRIPIIEFAIG